MFSNLGTAEIVIIGLILLFFFGSKKLTELARGMGEATKEVKKIHKEVAGGGEDEDK
jgi:sec-independent protein translocase protein TatA